MSRPRLAAQFVEGARGRTLVVARFPRVSEGRSVIVVPPFAEEMNKSRQAVSQLAQGLAESGIATILPDLGGTGDSDGEFCNADWDDWQQDIVVAAGWAAGQGWPVGAILGIRLGCALAAQAVQRLETPISRTVFWAPVSDGSVFLTQFLRLRVAATMMTDDPSESTADLRSRLAAGETLEIAGYALGPGLSAQIDRIRLPDLISPALGELCWIDVTRSDPPTVSAAAAGAIERARTTASRVSALAISGEPFWSSAEVVVSRELIEGTLPAFVGQL